MPQKKCSPPSSESHPTRNSRKTWAEMQLCNYDSFNSIMSSKLLLGCFSANCWRKCLSMQQVHSKMIFLKLKGFWFPEQVQEDFSRHVDQLTRKAQSHLLVFVTGTSTSADFEVFCCFSLAMGHKRSCQNGTNILGLHSSLPSLFCQKYYLPDARRL